MAKEPARDHQTDDTDATAGRVADLERHIGELEDVHTQMRAVITERGGIVPLDVIGADGRPVPFKMRLLELEHELRALRRELDAARKGHAERPSPGETYYVTAIPRPGAKQRGRRGLRFEHGARRRVDVVNASDAEVARRLQNGESIATPDGMLEILADPDLLSTQSATDDSVRTLRAERDAEKAENAALKAENAALKAAARRNAPDPNDGSPGRLKAAAKATDKEPDKG